MNKKIKKTNNSTLELKSYKKLLNFYKIIFEPSFIDKNQNINNILYECFFDMFKNTNIVSNEGITFEKISLDKSHIFASICRTSDLDVLTEIRGKKGINVKDIILESYTYFYIDFINLGISIIKTQKIPQADGYIKNLIIKNSYINISLEPYKKSDKEIKQMLINKMSISFYDNTSNFIELKNINKSDCEISEFKIEAKLKKINTNFVNNLVNRCKNNNAIKKISVSSDTEEVDLIKSIFTKQVSIELTKDYKNDFAQIEDTLKRELLKIINT